MQLNNLKLYVRHYMRKFANADFAPALAAMDRSVGYMTKGDYVSSNPAMSAVRAPLATGLWVTAGLAVVMLLWGAFAPIDSATVASGKVMLQSNKKTIQHLEGGIIEEILVKDGDMVKGG